MGVAHTNIKLLTPPLKNLVLNTGKKKKKKMACIYCKPYFSIIAMRMLETLFLRMLVIVSAHA